MEAVGAGATVSGGACEVRGRLGAFVGQRGGAMAGSFGSAVEPTASDQHADVSAGIAAEAEAIATLLAASDALLYDLD